jgi:hypothetical protein
LIQKYYENLVKLLTNNSIDTTANIPTKALSKFIMSCL